MLLQDKAYGVWQRMIKSGIIPNEVTQRILASCFGNNVQMASALVKEAQQLRTAAEVDPARRRPASKMTSRNDHEQAFKTHVIEGAIDSRGPYVLDLHGLSRPAAALALQRRLDFYVARPFLFRTGQRLKPNLQIVTGIGRHSHASVEAKSMQHMVKRLLTQLKLPYEPGRTAGRVQVPHAALCQYVQQQVQSSAISTFLHEASFRYLMVFGSVSGVCAAMYVIPKLLM